MEAVTPAQKTTAGVARSANNTRSAYHPSQYKKRFCSSYPNVSQCRRGPNCAFAHCREEVRVPLLPLEDEKQFPRGMSDEFFMNKYKTLWCPVGTQHDWLKCPYAHNYQDARRPVALGYGAILCPFWNKKQGGAEYSQRCPLGVRCPYAHGAKEQLYHPHYFKTATCRDIRGKRCPRSELCAFFHKRAERRSRTNDEIDYSKPLPEENMPSGWVAEFLSQPFSAQEIGTQPGGANVAGGMPSMLAGADPSCYFPWLTQAALMSASASAPEQEPNHEHLALGSEGVGMTDMGTPAYIDMPPGFEKDSPRTQSTTSGEGDEEFGLHHDTEAAPADWLMAANAPPWPVAFDGCMAPLYEPMLQPFSNCVASELLRTSASAALSASPGQNEQLWWSQAHHHLPWWDGSSS
eukprot:TRINITY_DN48679_c0_g1_i1.p1 TRINITY_DN48679_c0_g1~~TRINITY_DN48679_c0_g1_i1.p1  ORF type:complete len:437 (+),score=53.44 TRINITY_DN48679_c0_g1_i1:96-1313(+)